MTEPDPIRLYVCTHKDCRRGKGHEKLLALARSVPGSVTVGCQGICDAPVVGLRRGDDLRWYRRVRGRTRDALARALRRGRPGKDLRRAEVRARRGRLRHARRMRALD